MTKNKRAKQHIQSIKYAISVLENKELSPVDFLLGILYLRNYNLVPEVDEAYIGRKNREETYEECLHRAVPQEIKEEIIETLKRKFILVG